ncbi:MAG: hypothetical protein KatS3mg025_0349 [Bacteroidia bacterium]|nr:MAG: hypothetical protein KatS3mg025_0349 [Bacteroidia bacterium]
MRLFLVGFIAIGLLAQPLPDSLWYKDTAGDTTLRVFFQTFSEGWAASTFNKENGTWRVLGTDTLWIDAQERLLKHLRYIDTASPPANPSLAPFSQTLFSYPTGASVLFTTYDYLPESTSFVPRRRFHLWNTATRWDSVLSSQAAVFALGWNFYLGERLWPFPGLTDRALWGDSLLIEEFDPSFALFVEAGGYLFTNAALTCDSLMIYNPPRLSPIPMGYYTLCQDPQGRLLSEQDSLCSPAECYAQERFFTYDPTGNLTQDSMEIRFYTPQGQSLGSVTWVRRYQWSSAGRLARAEYPGGTYLLWYGSQVVNLEHGQPSPPQLLQRGKEITLTGLRAGTPLRLYNVHSQLLWEEILGPEGKISLPENLPWGIYILMGGAHVWKLFLHP